MKILRLTTLLDFGGQEKQYISFTEKPELLKFEYEFAAIGYGGNAERVLNERGYKVHVLNRKFSIKNLSNIWAVYKLIKKVQPDVVHTAAAEANFHGIIAAKLAGVKHIIGEEIGIPNHSSKARKVFAWVYKWAGKVICVSQSVRDHLVKIGEIPKEKGMVIYNPVAMPKKYTPNPSDKFQIVYVGRLEKVKNVKSLIGALSEIDHENVELTLVGDGRERENLENLAKEMKLSDHVVFEGFQPEPGKYLSAADLYVLPSYSEGFGIAAVEAMLLGIPVLCSNVGGIPEFVKDGENGWLFDPKDQKELASKMRMLLSLKKEELKEVGMQGFNSVSNVFTEKKYVKSLENLYENS
ncbi:glycosyltransferase family 4 protein [Sphingobacterium lumbrici]|uniref:glycosyltransferase family 4 protein n=1 Tax=Sphingobacterium lumbrici TaxID=2559600 RepID=UPI00112A521C|nr:glycosyltransferase family 4 protein [Sphingobacterium lumbrici]